MTDKKTGLYASLAKAQKEFKIVEKKKKATIKGTNKAGYKSEYTYKFADLADVLKMVLPILADNDLCLTQHTKIEGSLLTLHTKVTHIDGDCIESEYPVCSIAGEHQKMGSALTYSRRYGLSSLLAIATDDDADGVEAATVQKQETAKPKEDDKTAMQKANALVNWLPDCKSTSTLEAAETKAVAELKPHLEKGDWLRLESEMNARFSQLADKQENT